MARYAFIAAGLALGLVIGCGGGGTDTRTTSTLFGPFGERLPPVKASAEWSEGLCSAIITYNDSLSSAADHLTGGMLSTRPDLTASEVESATNTFTNDLNELGKPDANGGEQAKDAVEELAGFLESSADEMESYVRESDLFGDPTESVRTTLELMVAEVSTTFKRIERLDGNSELANAFQQAESCATLVGRR